MKKKDGFPGQISFVIPERVLHWVKTNHLISDLYITDIGYYPEASHHFRERQSGCPENILIYNVKGTGYVQLGQVTHVLTADHFILIPTETPHRYYSDVSSPWSIYWVHFSGRKAALFYNYANTPKAIEKNKLSRIGERIDMFTDIFSTLDRGFSHENLEYVNMGFGRLLSTFTHLDQFRYMKFADEKDPVVRSIDYMLENLNRKLSLQDISSNSGYSASHFSRMFTKKTGHSPVDYFIQLKIQRACRLLDNFGLTVDDVAREIGVDDQFYFSRVFRKMMGVSPVTYRKQLKGKRV